MSSIGIGGVKVDTRLGAESFSPGEMVSGEIYISGGDDEQEFNRIYIAVVTSYKHDESTHEYTLVSNDVSGSLRVGAKENRTIPFTFDLPYDIPLTLGHTYLYATTGLDISGALDPSDSDEIRVNPNALQQAVLEAAQSLGFILYQVENEHDPRARATRARSSNSWSSGQPADRTPGMSRSWNWSLRWVPTPSTFSSNSTAGLAL